MAKTIYPDHHFSTYQVKITSVLASGNATEHTYRPALQDFIQAFSETVRIVNEPKKQTKFGKPDFGVYNEKNEVIGYIETKDIGKDLDEAEKTEQWSRYRSIPNIILTDYLEFRWYVDGELKRTARLGVREKGGKVRLDETGPALLTSLFDGFLSHSGVSAGTPEELAERMAGMAQHIRDLIRASYGAEEESDSLHSQLNAFQKMLIPDLSPDAFADMYAQTIAYGLFAARCSAKSGQGFTRQTARELIPRTNPFLREIFDRIAGAGLPDEVAWLVEDLARLLARADMAEILKNFGKATAQEDPVVHFYETFLSAYDPKLREKRGVYYTPQPVVSFIVRSVDHILKETFGRKDGMADASVRILDPATGTGSFLYAVIQHIYEEVKAQGRAGVWDDVVGREILPRLFGFELLMAPYTVAHLKLSLELQRLGYRFQSKERLGVYLTNTLEEAVKKADVLFEETIAAEGQKASQIKQSEPIMVVLGNPPYFGISSNRSEEIRELAKGDTYEDFILEHGQWRSITKKTKKRGLVKIKTFIGHLLMDYFLVDGKPLNERKTWLQDDYVKFIRFGQWRIDKTGQGILAFITNHGYLDNPTFRGMRRSLMKTFNEIYILDLHGNAMKKETAPNGGPDKNVFDITRGVAIGIFVKRLFGKGEAVVRHAELFGDREGKYRVLSEKKVSDVKWKVLETASPQYPFVPRDRSKLSEYEVGWKITDIFPVNTTGIVTARDHFVVDFNGDELLGRIKEFANPAVTDNELRRKYFDGKGSDKYADGDTRGWKLPEARRQVGEDRDRDKRLAKILYRPFDTRAIYYTPWMVDWPRTDVMRHMLTGNNIGLIFMRQASLDEGYSHFGVTNTLVDNRAFYSSKGIMSFSPLWLYADQKDLFSNEGRKPNITPEFLNVAKRCLGDVLSPEDIFHYAYAVFHSPTYRERYGEFLKIDFPRVPLTSDKKLFKALATKGSELVALHLLESSNLDASHSKFETPGSRLVEKVAYDEKARRVRINADQFFSGVEKDVWEFQVGGYQVCEKWLKDRKERKLSADDVLHYQKIVAAIHYTIRLMAEIDALIPEWPIK